MKASVNSHCWLLAMQRSQGVWPCAFLLHSMFVSRQISHAWRTCQLDDNHERVYFVCTSVLLSHSALLAASAT